MALTIIRKERFIHDFQTVIHKRLIEGLPDEGDEYILTRKAYDILFKGTKHILKRHKQITKGG